MRILVTGATGFLGRHVTVALRSAGHDVHELTRRAGGSASRYVAGDFAFDLDPTTWRTRLEGFEAVVNCVGILKEGRGKSFANVHVAAPRALFEACVLAGVHRVIQISALGADDEARSRYHLSKARADRHLMQLPVHWCVLRPSLVFGEGGASVRLFASLASMPFVLLPGSGAQRVRPVHVDDVASLCVRILESDACDRTIIAVVGPRIYTVRGLLAALRESLGLPAPRFVRVPMGLMRALALFAGPVARIPLDPETLAMLERGNVASSADITAALGRPPREAIPFIDAQSGTGLSTLADWARLNWILPLLRASIALVWIVTGIVSLGIYPRAESFALLARVGLHGMHATLALYGAAALDLVLGIGTLVLKRRLWLWRAQIGLIAAYSFIIAIALPEYWLHPFGPLLKNVPMLAMLIALHELERRH